MEKQTIKLLGKGLQRDLALPNDIPFPIREALKSMVEAELQHSSRRQGSALQRPAEFLDRQLLHCRSNDNSGGA